MIKIPEISVIVPVYNTESYLEQCIDSILKQSYVNIELIIIDDASTDKSLEVCSTYAKIDKRVVVLCNNHNLGVSETRNIGLKIAQGRYVVFVDSDDYIENNMLEIMHLEAEQNNASIVQCGFYVNNKKSYKHKRLIYTQNNSIIDFLKLKNLNGYIWGKMFRKSIIGNTLFDTSLCVGEDGLFVFSVLLQSHKNVILSDKFYFHNYRSGSLSNKGAFSENIFDNFKQIEKVYDMNAWIDKVQIMKLKDAFAFVLYYRVYQDLFKYKKKNEYRDEWKEVLNGLNATKRHAIIYGKSTTKMKGFLWLLAEKKY